MMLARFALALSLATPALAAGAGIGPPPSWADAKIAAAADVRKNLNDPFSARFQFRTAGVVRGKKEWLICGRVNAKNQYGGYVGWQMFQVGATATRTTSFRLAPIGLGIDACQIKNFDDFSDEPGA